MNYPIEIIKKLSKKYFSIKADAVSYDVMCAEMQKRNTKLNILYGQLLHLENELKNADSQIAVIALGNILDLNKEIEHSECPVNQEHQWITPTCFNTGYDINGNHIDFYSSYTICKSCKNFIVNI